MILIKLLRFILGYLRVSVTGTFPERLLNICAAQGIQVWNTRKKGDSIEFHILKKDYRKLRRFRKSCGVRLKVCRKYGLPFITVRYRKRSGLLVGAAVFAAVLITLPKFVWGVSVSGVKSLDEDEILASLRDIGVYEGAKLSDIDADNMRLRLTLLMPDISWAAINIDGSFINVEIRQADKKIETDTRPSNMVAAFDGRVTAVYVKSGNAAVKVGDAVVKGDMLVSGTEQYSSGTTVFRHSDARIVAEVGRQLTVRVPLKDCAVTDTGRIKTRRVLTVFGRSVPLYIGEVGGDYRLETDTKPVVIGGRRLPIELTTGRFCEVKRTGITLSHEQAYKKGLELLGQKEKEQLPGFEVISRDITEKTEKDALVLTAKYLCSGDIAKTEYFYISEGQINVENAG